MKLPFVHQDKSKTDTSVHELFFVLRLTPSLVQAGLCEVKKEKHIKVLASSRFLTWSGNDGDQLLQRVDEAFSEVANYLPKGMPEPNKVLFGIPANWVEKGKPLPVYKGLLKKLSKELNLKALGFAVTFEAIVSLLNHRESVPVTGLILTLDKQFVEVSLVFQGKVQQVEVVERQSEIISSLKEAVPRFPSSQLPARIVVFGGGEDMDPILNELVNYDWKRSSLGFLHLPKIDLLPNDLPIKSLMAVAGQSIGAKIEDLQDGEEKERIENEEVRTEKKIADDSKTVQGVETVRVQTKEPSIIENESNEVKEVVMEKTVNEFVGKKPLMEGFVIGQDIRDVGSASVTDTVIPVKKTLDVKKVDEVMRVDPPVGNSVETKNVGKVFHPPKLKWSKSFRFPWKLFLVFLLILAIVGSGIYYLFENTRAKLTLLVKPKLLENELVIRIDPTISESDVETGVLRGKVLTVDLSGAKSKGTTGTALVGDRAKGEVTLFNDTETVRNLEAGVVLTSAKGLKFTLDEPVKVASKSVDLESDSLFKPGSVKASVTAEKIGADYNVGSNALFSVANFSQGSILARNESAFKGGSSREIQSVSKSDRENLLSELRTELESQADEKFAEQLGEGDVLIDSSIETEVVDQAFDQEVGDAVEKLSLTMGLRFTGVSYSKIELDDLIKNQLVDRVSLNQELSDVVSTDFKFQEQDGEQYVFDVITKSYLLPKLNADNIKEKIKGKRPEIVKDYLASLPAVNQVRNEITPKLPSFLSWMMRFPFKVKNIEVEIVPEE